jgi:hypothetical protein
MAPPGSRCRVIVLACGPCISDFGATRRFVTSSSLLSAECLESEDDSQQLGGIIIDASSCSVAGRRFRRRFRRGGGGGALQRGCWTLVVVPLLVTIVEAAGGTDAAAVVDVLAAAAAFALNEALCPSTNATRTAAAATRSAVLEERRPYMPQCLTTLLIVEKFHIQYDTVKASTWKQIYVYPQLYCRNHLQHDILTLPVHLDTVPPSSSSQTDVDRIGCSTDMAQSVKVGSSLQSPQRAPVAVVTVTVAVATAQHPYTVFCSWPAAA